jgi:dTDP-4-amino-4,6-dideoxygalactose transaminase
MRIPLLDLMAQYRGIEPEIERAMRRVLDSQQFILGPVVQELEEAIADYVGVPRAVACASGTDALLLPLLALAERHGPGKSVIVPTFTFFATAGAVWNAGLRPVFCDVDPDTFNVTPELLEAAWADDTVAVVPVHLFGQMAPIHEIGELAQSRGALVIEDAAQSLGAARVEHGDRTRAGARGDFGAISFFPSKNLGGFGDGGMITTRDPALAEVVRTRRAHGESRAYHHDVVGTNSRLDALQAAVLLAKLPHLEGWSARRRENAALYSELLAEVEEIRTPEVDEGNEHVFNQYTLRVPRRDELRSHLAERGIGTGVYYPTPLHLQACFAALGYARGDLPNSERLCREVLSLPVYPELGRETIVEVAETLRAFYQG